jgi:uncharacterized membrane protein
MLILDGKGGPSWQSRKHGNGSDRATSVARAGPIGRYRGKRGSRKREILGMDDEQLANALGWFSIGLGLAEVSAPGSVARLIGVSDDDRNRWALRALGLREVVSGVGILAQPRPAGWLWARVGGDLIDLAYLGAALKSRETRGGRLAAAMAAVGGVMALDMLCAERLSADGQGRRGRARPALSHPWRERAVHVRKAITIGRSAEDLYRFWRDFGNLPRFMRHLEAVQAIDDRRSHWTAKAPLGRTVEWDAEVTEERPHERLAWRSLEGADVPNHGSVSFEPAPGGRGTVVKVDLRYEPPGGVIGATIAWMFGEEPGQQVQEDLRAFKQLMETGAVVQSEATVKGGGAAQPPAQRRAREEFRYPGGSATSRTPEGMQGVVP